MAHRNRWGAATAAAALITGGLALVAAPQAQAADWNSCLQGPRDRQAVFSRAAATSGVPATVLMGVSYLESRWDDHGARVSASGGYGPMHLTQDEAAAHAAELAKAKGDGSAPARTVGTLTRAARLTGFSRAALRSDDVANICGGAAVLAASQPRTTSARPASWSKAVARYAGTPDAREQLQFARQVFTVIRSGEARTTNDGQRVVLPATRGAAVDTAAVDAAGTIPSGNTVIDCPIQLDCESVPAPYQLNGDGTNPGNYGNHDLANRPADGLSIDYIVIHDTEGSYNTSLKLVQDPTYLGWHYTIRSADGHVAQHINPKNVGFQAGNWYVNMHSIGIEHEGFAATGASWYTESMYRSSATLVRYLAHEYGVPLDRAHIIGHDQVPGITTANIPGMHWDPGPYWDWEHYMRLLGAPIGSERGHMAPTGTRPGQVVTVIPGFEDNPQPVTGCDGTAAACPRQGTNFVYLHQQPSDSSPLVADVGMRPGSTSSTTGVSDIGARAAAGQKLAVAQRSGDWTAVWYLGQLGWIRNENLSGDRVLRPARGTLVTTAGDSAVPVYGRAYPEASAYPSEIPYQTVSPLVYTIKPGQAYVLADPSVRTDYYYAKTYDSSLPRDHTVVVGKDRYYQIWFGHRIAYVRAADVTLGKKLPTGRR
jgi:hypothetical protein